MRRAPAGGYTLVEMLVVMALLGILAAAAMPLVELSAKRGKERELKAALWEIRQAIDGYKNAHDRGLIGTVTPSGYPPALAVLVDGVENTGKPGAGRIYFLRRVPRDPFAPQDVAAERSWGLRSYASPPDRPQPGADVYDVHSTSSEVGMNGVPYSQW
ncbi:type II secretion system protein [Massilia sp. METH4]|uniref:type II secretion system protein n=1 Tax=Massilia sp. METH4 TaxID=3123041 RepID=UPI0030D42B2C